MIRIKGQEAGEGSSIKPESPQPASLDSAREWAFNLGCGGDSADAVQELNKAIDRAPGLLRSCTGPCILCVYTGTGSLEDRTFHMTLILTVAKLGGMYQSSDYQLTQWGTNIPVTDVAGSKQLSASFRSFRLVIAFTGVATWKTTVGSSIRTIDHLRSWLSQLRNPVDFQTICEKLRSNAQKSYGTKGGLTLVLGCVSLNEPPQVAEIFNTNWLGKPPLLHDFKITIRKARQPFHLISGSRDCVCSNDRHRLTALSKNVAASDLEVMTALSEINSNAAEKSNGAVSGGCWATAQSTDGEYVRSASHNFRGHGGIIPAVIQGVDVTEMIEKIAAGGRIVQAASNMGTGVKPQMPLGEPRTFALSAPTSVYTVMAPSRQYCASIDVGPIDASVTARLNERVLVKFAPLRVRTAQVAAKDFPKPPSPWPKFTSAISIDGVAIPNGLEYEVVHWIEDSKHRLDLPEAKQRFRDVAFLCNDDELEIVIPATEISWDPIDDEFRFVSEAFVTWRARRGKL